MLLMLLMLQAALRRLYGGAGAARRPIRCSSEAAIDGAAYGGALEASEALGAMKRAADAAMMEAAAAVASITKEK